MRLHYYRATPANFGDDLNDYLWSRLLPANFFDSNADVLFLGVGTLLNRHLPQNRRFWVLGTGAGYGDPPAHLSRFKIFALRGPRTAQALGVSSDLVATDAA